MGVVCDVEDAPECEIDVRDCTVRCQDTSTIVEPEVIHPVETRHVVHHTPPPVHHPVRPVYVPPPVHYSPRKTY